MASNNTKESLKKYNQAKKAQAKAGSTSKADGKGGSRSGRVNTVQDTEQTNERKTLSLTAAVVLGLFIALLLELSNFDVLGTFGSWMKMGQFGLFGTIAYIFPIGILLTFIASTDLYESKRYIGSGAVIFVFICVFTHLVSSVPMDQGDILSFFTFGYEQGIGGGLIGGAIAYALYILLARVGAIIIAALVILGGFFIMFEPKIVEFFRSDGSEYPYEDTGTVLAAGRNKKRNAAGRTDRGIVTDLSSVREPDRRAAERKTQVKENISAESGIDHDDRDDNYPVYVENDGNETVIRIVHKKPSKNRTHSADMVRAENKARPLRNGSVQISRSDNKMKGLSSATVINHRSESDDEIREITERTYDRKQKKNDHLFNLGMEEDGQQFIKGFADPEDYITPFDDEIAQEAEGSRRSNRTQDEESGADARSRRSIRTQNEASGADARCRRRHYGYEDGSAFESASSGDRASLRGVAGFNITDIKGASKSDSMRAAAGSEAADISSQDGMGSSRENKSRHISGYVDTKDGKAATLRTSVDKPVAVRIPNSCGSSDENFKLPPLSILSTPKGRSNVSEAELTKVADDLELILKQFGVNVTVTDIQTGPSVTRYELQPELGTRVSKITSLADDLKLNLGVTEIRIEAPIPGRQAVGIELPNKNRQTVYMRELLEDKALTEHKSKIAFAAGKDISGNVIVADIAKMPHLLVAGTTGSGKSVFLNSILMTILYRAKPSEVGLIIIDPKKVEFGVYAGIPHLMKDVVTDPGQAVSTLRWAVNEMTIRYQRMQMAAVRDFKSYNEKLAKGKISPQEENPRKMNQIVIIIDELADLMMVAKKEAESLICRLAQLARAAGIHLIIATQRPSVDVVTGLIKANVPARVALLVSSQIDSRTIIDMAGAEKLLGNGDMLFYPTGFVKPVRIQGAYVTDDEIQDTVNFLISNNDMDYFAAEAKEIEKFMTASQGDVSGSEGGSGASEGSSKYDEFFYEAALLCIEVGKASSSMLQRRFNLGFNRAARIVDQMEEFGVIGPQNGSKPREILMNAQTFETTYDEMKNN